MMLDVVLDENAYVFALEAECSRDPVHERCARIVILLQKHHRWIFTPDVLRAYHRRFSRNRCRGVLPTRLMKSLDEVLADQSRSRVIFEPPLVEGAYHRKDRHVVAAAATVNGCYLVTMDDRLRIALEAAGIPDKFGFTVVAIESAEAAFDVP